MGGWIDGSAVDFSWTPLSNGKGLRGTRWSPAGGSRGHRSEEKEGDGVFKAKPLGPPPLPAAPYIKADPPLGRFVRQACNR